MSLFRAFILVLAGVVAFSIRAASRAMPAPVIPPPMTSRSIGSAAMALSAAARVTWDRAESGIGSLYRRWGATLRVADRLDS